MLRMDEINKIRNAFFIDGESKNAIAKRFNRSWDTVDRIVSMKDEDLKFRGKRPKRKCKVITPEVLEAIEKYIIEEKEKLVKKKQRYTAKKIYEDLVEKGTYKGSLRRIEDTVQALRHKHSQLKTQSYLPLGFVLGSAIQVDHGEADLIINKQRCQGYLFVGSVPGECLRYCQIFPLKSSEAWGEFHERKFRFFGGVFSRAIYDNDSVLVKEVMGSERKQTDFSHSLEVHYIFKSHFCNLASGNEKGAVENAVGYCRRNFLAGCPEFEDWSDVNQYLEACSLKDISIGSHYKRKEALLPVFEELKQKLRAMPPRKTWCKHNMTQVNSYQLVSVDSHHYSVPEKYVGTSVRVELGIFGVRFYKDNDLIASYERRYDGNDSLCLDHYLDQLQYKSGALQDCRAVQNHKFDVALIEIHKRLSERHPQKESNRQFVKILLLGRKYAQKDLIAAVNLSLECGAVDPSAVEMILRQPDAKQNKASESELKERLETQLQFEVEFDLSPYGQLCQEVTS